MRWDGVRVGRVSEGGVGLGGWGWGGWSWGGWVGSGGWGGDYGCGLCGLRESEARRAHQKNGEHAYTALGKVMRKSGVSSGEG